MIEPEAPPPFSRRVTALKLSRQGSPYALEADEAQRLAIAAALDLPAVHAFAADLEARTTGSGRYSVTGLVKARIRQLCALTAEEFDSDVSAPVEARFADDEQLPAATKKEIERTLADEDPPEPLLDGQIDIGALAVEFLALALDPFPRKPGAAFTSAEVEADSGPFAALAALKQAKTP